MSVLILLMAASLTIAVAFLALFVWAVRSGQFDDTVTPSMRVLLEEPDEPAGQGAGGQGSGDLAKDNRQRTNDK